MKDGLPHIVPTAVDLLFIMACMGILVAERWVIPRGARDAQALRYGLWRLLGPVLAGLTLVSVIGLLLRTAEMSGLPLGKALPAVPLTLSKTHYGMTWIVRMVGVSFLWLGWGWMRKGRVHQPSMEKLQSSSCLYAMLAAAACVVWSVSASSHAADWGDFTWPEWVSWLHISAGSVWVGGILAFVAVTRRRRNRPTLALATFATCARNLSRMAGMALTVVLASGVYNVWRQLDRFSDLVSSGYGRIVLFKILLVFAMIALGAGNRYFNLPFLCRHAGITPPARQTDLPVRILRRINPSWKPCENNALVRQFGRRIAVEAWLALAVVACAAWLGHAMPPQKHGDRARAVVESAATTVSDVPRGRA